MAGNPGLPEMMKALVLKSRSEPLTVETVPTPQVTLGSAVVRVLAANILSYMRDVYNGNRPYPFPTPIIPGVSAVARVVAVGAYSDLRNPSYIYTQLLLLTSCPPTLHELFSLRSYPEI